MADASNERAFVRSTLAWDIRAEEPAETTLAGPLASTTAFDDGQVTRKLRGVSYLRKKPFRPERLCKGSHLSQILRFLVGILFQFPQLISI